MTVKRRSMRIWVAALAGAALLLGGCAPADGGGGTKPSEEVSSEPVAGGVAQIVEVSSPTSMDPARIRNIYVGNTVLGNALYGQLLTDDAETAELQFSLLEDFATDDEGKTFTLTIRDGVTFSDGSPFTAAAIQYGWERLLDPETRSGDVGVARLVEAYEVVDDRTLRITMTDPMPSFPHAVLGTHLNWIAQPEALEAGTEAFDAAPIGAGPFVLDSWSRQDVVVLERNEQYWDAPRPYLDRIELRGIVDLSQRYNAVLSGQADLATETGAENIGRAEEGGLTAVMHPVGGGGGWTINTSKPPFDDVRARQALISAIDLDAMNVASQGGYAIVPETLFVEGTPFFSDVPLPGYDPELAQRLFDELAAEGKPVDFAATFYATGTATFESLQAQLSQYDNVTVTADVRDLSEVGLLPLSGDFQLLSGSVLFGADPGPRIWVNLHSRGELNYSRISDPEMDAALDRASTSTDTEERVEAYRIVQERFAELVPYLLTGRPVAGYMANDNIHGMSMYGIGSLSPADMWIEP
ncbi:ABC transporter substrate-binding protein [Microbacterium sp. No. 7]|uniref:ABC transporter substrate-binding protein n=1 Tax=Microbacterium sp. No. 7 TaxID=1714373 RepID=UPI0006ED3974|nr:ABC transporter substrate-binding protein [Microbacterium sp. No. 7]ALJ21203.1 hypothetical protein AOA12_15355 [Microbacterium sp. No. 7]